MKPELVVMIVGVVLLAIGIAIEPTQAESKYVLSSKRLSSTEVALSCSNGADPTGQKVGQTVIISCGR